MSKPMSRDDCTRWCAPARWWARRTWAVCAS